jgi:hypothetical protein
MDTALAGIWIRPRQMLSCSSSSGRLAWLVAITGRVCGTAIGTDPMETTSRTPKCCTTARTPSANASQWVSGSMPDRRRYGVPRRSRSRRTTSLGATYPS